MEKGTEVNTHTEEYEIPLAEEYVQYDTEGKEEIQDNKETRSQDSKGVSSSHCTPEVVDTAKEHGRKIPGEMDLMDTQVRHKGDSKIREDD